MGSGRASHGDGDTPGIAPQKPPRPIPCPYWEHLEDLHAQQDEAPSPAVAGQADGDVPQVLGEEDDEDDGPGESSAP